MVFFDFRLERHQPIKNHVCCLDPLHNCIAIIMSENLEHLVLVIESDSLDKKRLHKSHESDVCRVVLDVVIADSQRGQLNSEAVSKMILVAG